MTKKDFENIISNGYETALSKFTDKEYIFTFLSEYADENQKISSENLAAALILMATEISRSMISSVLQEVLELDD